MTRQKSIVAETTLQSWPVGGHDPELDHLLATHAPDGSTINLTTALSDPLLGETALVSSFGAESVVLIHLVWKACRDIPVVFIDTGRHFPATLAYVDHLKDALNLNLHVVSADAEHINREDPHKTLDRINPDQCCQLRKGLPLSDALQGYDSWISGRKRYHGGARSHLPLFERDGDKIKLNPMARWDQTDVQAYFEAHDLPRHPLERFGFLSIGCEPCTRAVEEGEDARAGRWAHTPEKIECGIHISPEGKIIRLSQQ